MAKLVVFRGDAVEHETHLAGPTVRIGRDSLNEIVLDDKSVSRFHAEVRAEGGTYFIVDLKSRNGVWVNGQQIKKKAALALGVPVTLGAYELALEDDVATGEFGEEAPLQHTVVNPASVERPDGASRSATRVMANPSTAPATKPNVRLWSGIAAVLALIGLVSFAVVRYTNRPDPTVAAIDPVPPLQEPPPTPEPSPAPAGDPGKEATAQHLAAARVAIQNRDYLAAVRDHLSIILAVDPANQEALELKRQADAALVAAQPRKPVPAPVKPPEPQPAEIETPDIPRRPNEAWADYTARVKRIQGAFAEGKVSLDKQDFAAAIARFQSVERDQKGYQGVESLIRDTTTRQRTALAEALDGGLKNEQADRASDALKWYQRALVIDPASSTARDRAAALGERLGLAAFADAEVLRKRGDSAKASQFYRQAVDSLPRGHEKSREAAQWLEKLKP